MSVFFFSFLSQPLAAGEAEVTWNANNTHEVKESCTSIVDQRQIGRGGDEVKEK